MGVLKLPCTIILEFGDTFHMYTQIEQGYFHYLSIINKDLVNFSDSSSCLEHYNRKDILVQPIVLYIIVHNINHCEHEMDSYPVTSLWSKCWSLTTLAFPFLLPLLPAPPLMLLKSCHISLHITHLCHMYTWYLIIISTNSTFAAFVTYQHYSL